MKLFGWGNALSFGHAPLGFYLISTINYTYGHYIHKLIY